MKKTICLIALIALSLSGFTQDNPDASAGSKGVNILKLNLTSLYFPNIYLQDEYVLNGRSSVALGVSMLPARGLPDQVKSDNSDISSLEFSGWSITPEYRYHFSNKAPKGFYIAPYFRYAHYSTNTFTYKYNNSNNQDVVVSMQPASYTGTTVGLMLGSQWKLGDHVVLDWWIIGIGFGSCTYEVTGHGNFTTQDQADFKSDIDDISTPFGTISSTVNATTASIKYKTSIAARGFGLNLGYIF